MFSHSAWHKKRFAENAEYREKIRAAQRRYRQKHKEEMTERRRRKWQTDAAYREQQRARDREWKRRKRYEVYGMSLADYEAMLERQRGACAICKKSDEALCVDHCHACGKVRGLLCAKCNSALGFCNDSPEHLLAAVAYLQAARVEEQARSMPAIASGKPDEPREHTGECSIADARHCRCASKPL